MFACPHCHAPSMSFWRKLSLGAGRSVSCASCGNGMAVSWWSFVAFLPFSVSFFTYGRLPWGWAIVCTVAGLVFYALAHTFLVPLIRR